MEIHQSESKSRLIQVTIDSYDFYEWLPKSIAKKTFDVLCRSLQDGYREKEDLFNLVQYWFEDNCYKEWKEKGIIKVENVIG